MLIRMKRGRMFLVEHGSLEHRVSSVIENTVNALRQGREQMFDIVETANAEYNRIQLAIEELKIEMHRCVDLVDAFEKDFSKMRRKLYQVSQDFDRYTEAHKRDVYEQADAVRENLAKTREKEQQLRGRRDELERSLVRMKEMVERSEALVAQVGVALEFLQGDLSGITTEMENLEAHRQLSGQVIRIQEEERKRVAREIHDGPAQDMANVVLKADLCEKFLSLEERQKAIKELHELKDMVKLSLKEVRRIMFNLRPMALDDLGLVPTLKRYLEDIQQQSAFSVELSVQGTPRRLSTEAEVSLFRIVQEALNNSRKHSRATNVNVKLDYGTRYVSATIQDNGVGFAPDGAETELLFDQYGLMNMRERAEYLGGTLSVTSEPRQGTRVLARLPLNTEGRTQDGNEH